MTEQELRDQYPDAVSAIERAAIGSERVRRDAISAVAATDPSNAALQALCTGAIAEGTSPDDAAFRAASAVAIRDHGQRPGNAPEVQTEAAPEPDSEIKSKIERLGGMV